MLAEYGVDVVKIESRTYPDFIRTVLGVDVAVVRIVESEQAEPRCRAKHPEGRACSSAAAVSDIAIENNSIRSWSRWASATATCRRRTTVW